MQSKLASLLVKHNQKQPSRVAPPKLVHARPPLASTPKNVNATAPKIAPPPLSRPMEATPTSGMKLVIRTVKSETPANGVTSDIIDPDGYKVYIGRDHNRTFDDQVACKGCNKILPCWGKNSKHRKYSPEYYYHCVNECEQYKQLGLIRHCHECKNLFATPNMFNKHVCENGMPKNGNGAHAADPNSSLEDDAINSSDPELMSGKEEEDAAERNFESLVIEPDIFIDSMVEEPDPITDPAEEVNSPSTSSATALVAPKSSKSQSSTLLTTVYQIHVPESSALLKSFPHRAPCPGCQKFLPCFNDKTTRYHSPQYYKVSALSFTASCEIVNLMSLPSTLLTNASSTVDLASSSTVPSANSCSTVANCSRSIWKLCTWRMRTTSRNKSRITMPHHNHPK